MEDQLELRVRLVADRLDLALVAVALGLLLKEGAQGRDVALAEYLPQKPDVLLVSSRHRRPSTGQDCAWDCPAGQACAAVASSGVTVTRRPPPIAPTRL